MIFGLLLIIFGIVVILHPEILAFLFGGFIIMLGVGMMTASWQFRRMKKTTDSHVMKWFLRF